MWVFIVNPVAGNGKGKAIFEKLQKTETYRSLDSVYSFSEYEGHVEELARNWKDEDNITGMVIVGGDGTIHEAINGIGATDIPIGFIPAGSGNDFARGIGVKGSPETLLKQFVHSNDTRKYWLGTYKQNGHKRRYFVNSMGFGFDALTAHTANQANYKKLFNQLRFGTGGYVTALLQVLVRFRPFTVEMIKNNKKRTIDQCWLVSVGNHPYYGGGMKIMPNAKIQPDKFSVLIVHSLPKWKVLALFLTVFTGTHEKIKGVELVEASQLTVKVDDEIYTQVDGQTSTTRETEIRKMKDSIQIIIPK